MKILADSVIPWLDKLFAQHGEIIRYTGREIEQTQLQDIDVLLTRSTLKITKDLLKNTSVKFVASATVGCDHVDQNALQKLGVAFAHAPGCNANAVSEYVVCAIAWHEKEGVISFGNDLTAAVIGCGRIGSKVKEKLEILGFNVVVNDPPLEQSFEVQNTNYSVTPSKAGVQKNEKAAYSQIDDDNLNKRFHDSENWNFVDLNQALQADVICMHTPLTKVGENPTFHLIDEKELKHINPNAILINAGRGEVINNPALLDRLEQMPDLNVVLDVWENEPNINQMLLHKVNLGTPHIAGHSWRGKVMGTVMIYQQACDFFGWKPQLIDDNDFKVAVTPLTLTNDSLLYDLVAQCYDIEHDTTHLRLSVGEQHKQDIARKFDCLRKNYYQRPELSDLQCNGQTILGESKIKALGCNFI